MCSGLNRHLLLYAHLGDALIPDLMPFYARVWDIFELAGVHGRFVVQQSRASHSPRSFVAPSYNADGIGGKPGLVPLERAPAFDRALEALVSGSVPMGPPAGGQRAI